MMGLADANLRVTLYKEGEEPRNIYRVDAAGWLANGWTTGDEMDDKEIREPSTTVQSISIDPRVLRDCRLSWLDESDANLIRYWDEEFESRTGLNVAVELSRRWQEA